MILAEAINGIYFTNIFERKESVGGGRGEEGDFGSNIFEEKEKVWKRGFGRRGTNRGKIQQTRQISIIMKEKK